MAPDTRLRLAAVKKGLEDIIAPLIPADAAFAQEQLGLILRSIEIVRDQIPHEDAFLIHDAHAFAALGRELLELAEGQGAVLQPLRDAIDDVEAAVPHAAVPRAKVEGCAQAVRQRIEEAVDTLGQDPAMLAKIGPSVLRFTRRQTELERRWVVATGFDPAPADLPALDTFLYQSAPG
jgi:hypothetical protein